MNQLDTAGRVAIVTGAAQGLGLAIAKRLSESGAFVSLWDRDVATLERAQAALGVERTMIHEVDVTNADQIDAAAKKTAERYQKIDILVNNAGIMGPTIPTWDTSESVWRRVIDVNLTGTFLCCRAVVPYLRSGGYGRVVNLASIAGKEGNANAAAYSASKAGIIALTKSLGKELADSNVLVNCVAPAAVRTAIFGEMSDEYVDFIKSKIPMGRFGTADEIAALVSWLCTEECSFSTGAVFDLSGGRATY